MQFSGLSQNLISVPKGYPAYNSGLRKGDVVLSVEDSKGRINLGLLSSRGKKGEVIKVTYSRNGKIFKTKIVKDDICAEKIIK